MAIRFRHVPGVRLNPPLIVLLSALIATLIVTGAVMRVVAERERSRFDDLATITQNAIAQRMNAYVDMLRATAALFAATPEQAVTQAQFLRFVQDLAIAERYPGVRSVGWSPRVSAADKPAFLRMIQQQTRSTLSIWPAGTRSYYQPVLYSAAIDPRNIAAVGFDMYAEPARRAAMDRAAATGLPIATGKVELVREPDAVRRTGFIIYAPVYRADHPLTTPAERLAALYGFVYSPFSADDLVSGIFGLFPPSIAFDITDGHQAGADHLLLTAAPSSEAKRADAPTLEKRRTLDIAGRTWTLHFASTAAFEARSRWELVPLVLIGGLVFSLLLSAVTWAETRARIELEQVNTRLHESRQALAEADRRKDEFLAMLGHELRNPLAPIRSGLEVLGLNLPDTTKRARLLAMMSRQVAHMVRLIDDLLDVSRITRGKIHLRRSDLDLREAVQMALETVLPFFDGKQQVLTVSLPPQPVRLRADATRLVQVVENLLRNASKYTPATGKVTLTLTQNGEEAVLTVQDTGIGLEPVMLTRAFDLFAQADTSLDRAQGGLGIGLTLVRGIVELHGGQVSATSPGLEQGSTFTVRLPCRHDDDGPEARAADTPPVSTARRVLVVEDNIDAADALATLLQQCGHHTDVAYDGTTALAKAALFQPEVAILDIGLPGMDGYELARRLRAAQPALRLIAVTGYGNSADYTRTRQAGFDRHLLKPVPLAVLQETIDALCRPAEWRSSACAQTGHR